MRRKAMYEKPSQRRSVEAAFSAERPISPRRKILVCRESAGVLRTTRTRIRKMITAESTHRKRRDSQLTAVTAIARAMTKNKKTMKRGGGAAVKTGSGRK